MQTHVNGELRQDATTEDLIFSIPYLIKTMSEGQTLMPGDILATGTVSLHFEYICFERSADFAQPAGVGIGKKPPVYLKSGDIVKVSVTGLGTLTNRIGSASSINSTMKRFESRSYLQHCNAAKIIDTISLTSINNKLLHYKRSGNTSGSHIVFIHGLGGSAEFFSPLISSLSLEKSHSLHLFDLEGHGLSPSSPLSKIGIQPLAEDLNGIVSKTGAKTGVTLVAHSMGCLIAVQLALTHPDKVSKLILLGPPPSPLPETDSTATHALAETVRAKGMHAIVDAVADASTSEAMKTSNPLAIAAVRMSLLGQDPEGYAKACAALAEAPRLDFAALQPKTLIITGSEDKVSPPQLCEEYVQGLQGRASLQVLENVGHWHVFEDVRGTASAIKGFL